MLDLLQILLLLLIFLISIPVSVFTFQILSAIAKTRLDFLSGERIRTAIIIPAHNEAAVIDKTINSIRPQLTDNDTLLVVADNCADGTANIAASLGAQVIIRSDSLRRGKGYALDYGIQFLTKNPPEIVIFIDADCCVQDATIEKLVICCAKMQRPIQALYLMLAPEEANTKLKIAEFAWFIKNKIRPLGYYRWGLPCELMGSGMAFPWSIISQINLATSEIVEDLQLGINLTKEGHAPLFCPEAEVTSYFPSNTEAAKKQRTRWEFGHLRMIAKEFPGLFLKGVLNRDINTLSLAVDLCVPPLLYLVLLTSFLFFTTLIIFAVTDLSYPIIFATLLLSVLLATIIFAWWKFGRQILSFEEIPAIFDYTLMKVNLLFKFSRNRPLEWVKTKRDEE